MKHLKRAIPVVLALVMAFALSVSAWAEASQTIGKYTVGDQNGGSYAEASRGFEIYPTLPETPADRVYYSLTDANANLEGAVVSANGINNTSPVVVKVETGSHDLKTVPANNSATNRITVGETTASYEATLKLVQDDKLDQKFYVSGAAANRSNLVINNTNATANVTGSFKSLQLNNGTLELASNQTVTSADESGTRTITYAADGFTATINGTGAYHVIGSNNGNLVVNSGTVYASGTGFGTITVNGGEVYLGYSAADTPASAKATSITLKSGVLHVSEQARTGSTTLRIIGSDDGNGDLIIEGVTSGPSVTVDGKFGNLTVAKADEGSNIIATGSYQTVTVSDGNKGTIGIGKENQTSATSIANGLIVNGGTVEVVGASGKKTTIGVDSDASIIQIGVGGTLELKDNVEVTHNYDTVPASGVKAIEVKGKLVVDGASIVLDGVNEASAQLYAIYNYQGAQTNITEGAITMTEATPSCRAIRNYGTLGLGQTRTGEWNNSNATYVIPVKITMDNGLAVENLGSGARAAILDLDAKITHTGKSGNYGIYSGESAQLYIYAGDPFATTSQISTTTVKVEVAQGTALFIGQNTGTWAIRGGYQAAKFTGSVALQVETANIGANLTAGQFTANNNGGDAVVLAEDALTNQKNLSDLIPEKNYYWRVDRASGSIKDVTVVDALWELQYVMENATTYTADNGAYKIAAGTYTLGTNVDLGGSGYTFFNQETIDTFGRLKSDAEGINYVALAGDRGLDLAGYSITGAATENGIYVFSLQEHSLTVANTGTAYALTFEDGTLVKKAADPDGAEGKVASAIMAHSATYAEITNPNTTRAIYGSTGNVTINGTKADITIKQIVMSTGSVTINNEGEAGCVKIVKWIDKTNETTEPAPIEVGGSIALKNATPLAGAITVGKLVSSGSEVSVTNEAGAKAIDNAIRIDETTGPAITAHIGATVTNNADGALTIKGIKTTGNGEQLGAVIVTNTAKGTITVSEYTDAEAESAIFAINAKGEVMIRNAAGEASAYTANEGKIILGKVETDTFTGAKVYGKSITVLNYSSAEKAIQTGVLESSNGSVTVTNNTAVADNTDTTNMNDEEKAALAAALAAKESIVIDASVDTVPAIKAVGDDGDVKVTNNAASALNIKGIKAAKKVDVKNTNSGSITVTEYTADNNDTPDDTSDDVIYAINAANDVTIENNDSGSITTGKINAANDVEIENSDSGTITTGKINAAKDVTILNATGAASADADNKGTITIGTVTPAAGDTPEIFIGAWVRGATVSITNYSSDAKAVRTGDITAYLDPNGGTVTITNYNGGVTTDNIDTESGEDGNGGDVTIENYTTGNVTTGRIITCSSATANSKTSGNVTITNNAATGNITTKDINTSGIDGASSGNVTVTNTAGGNITTDEIIASNNEDGAAAGDVDVINSGDGNIVIKSISVESFGNAADGTVTILNAGGAVAPYNATEGTVTVGTVIPAVYDSSEPPVETTPESFVGAPITAATIKITNYGTLVRTGALKSTAAAGAEDAGKVIISNNATGEIVIDPYGSLALTDAQKAAKLAIDANVDAVVTNNSSKDIEIKGIKAGNDAIITNTAAGSITVTEYTDEGDPADDDVICAIYAENDVTILNAAGAAAPYTDNEGTIIIDGKVNGKTAAITNYSSGKAYEDKDLSITFEHCAVIVRKGIVATGTSADAVKITNKSNALGQVLIVDDIKAENGVVTIENGIQDATTANNGSVIVWNDINAKSVAITNDSNGQEYVYRIKAKDFDLPSQEVSDAVDAYLANPANYTPDTFSNCAVLVVHDVVTTAAEGVTITNRSAQGLVAVINDVKATSADAAVVAITNGDAATDTGLVIVGNNIDAKGNVTVTNLSKGQIFRYQKVVPTGNPAVPYGFEPITFANVAVLVGDDIESTTGNVTIETADSLVGVMDDILAPAGTGIVTINSGFVTGAEATNKGCVVVGNNVEAKTVAIMSKSNSGMNFTYPITVEAGTVQDTFSNCAVLIIDDVKATDEAGVTIDNQANGLVAIIGEILNGTQKVTIKNGDEATDTTGLVIIGNDINAAETVTITNWSEGQNFTYHKADSDPIVYADENKVAVIAGDRITSGGATTINNKGIGLVKVYGLSDVVGMTIDNAGTVETNAIQSTGNGNVAIKNTAASGVITVLAEGTYDGVKVSGTGNLTIGGSENGTITITAPNGNGVNFNSTGDLTIGGSATNGTITITAPKGNGVNFNSTGNLTIEVGTITGNGTDSYGLNVGASATDTAKIKLYKEDDGTFVSAANYNSVYVGDAATGLYDLLLDGTHDWTETVNGNTEILARTRANYMMAATNKRQSLNAKDNTTYSVAKVTPVLTVSPTSAAVAQGSSTTPTISLTLDNSGKTYTVPYATAAKTAGDATLTPVPDASGIFTITKTSASSTKGTVTYTSAYGVTADFVVDAYSGPSISGGDIAPAPSSGGGAAPAPTPTVSLSGDDNSVNISVSTSNGVATMSEPKAADLDKVIGAGVETGEVVIDMSQLSSSIDTATIPTKTFDTIEVAVTDASNDADELTIKLPASSVTFNAAALDAVADQATGSTISLEVSKEAVSKLASAQQNAVKELEVQDVYSITLTSGNKTISDFNGGSATVSVNYTLKSGQSARGIVVWYVANDGTLTEVPSTFSAGKVSFTVSHFSDYVIAYDAERAAACPQDSTCPIAAFSDADAKAWYHDGVHWALENGVMSGMGNGTFAPNGTTTRAMVAQILWNLEGKPAYVGMSEYSDVDNEDWFGPAVRWASAEGIVTGYDNPDDGGKIFNPNGAVTREQLATMLYRYAQYKNIDVSVGEDTNILSYEDAMGVSTWAMAAMQWACGAGVVNGVAANGTMYLQPQNNASRAVVATMIARFCTEVAK